MGKLIDMTGKKFGKWTVLHRSPGGVSVRWRCRCECGTEKDVLGESLRLGKTKGCGCWQVMKLDGTSSGLLTYVQDIGVLKGRRRIECLCACGNKVICQAYEYINGSTKSCGCIQKQSIRQIAKSRKENLIGRTFGRWIVMSEATGRSRWNVKCSCGNEAIVYGHTLKSGESQSCGCLQREIVRDMQLSKKGLRNERR